MSAPDAAIIYALDPVRHNSPPTSPVVRPGIWRWLLLSFSYLLHLPCTSRICYLQVYGAGFSYLLLGETLGPQGAAGAGLVLLAVLFSRTAKPDAPEGEVAVAGGEAEPLLKDGALPEADVMPVK